MFDDMFDDSEKVITGRRVGRPAKNSHDNRCDKRRLILRSASYLFFNRDYEKVSLRKIAKLSGVNPSLIAYYFIDKEGVYKAFLNEIILEQKRQFIDVSLSLKDHSFMGQGMSSIIDSHLETMQKEPKIMNLFFKVYFSDNLTEKELIIEHFIRPYNDFIKSKLGYEKSKQDMSFLGIMPGLIFTSALMECLDKKNRDKLFPSNFQTDMRKSIYSIDSQYSHVCLNLS